MATATATKERPIIFSSESVRAILAGAKTQTRRTNGLDEINRNPDLWRLSTVTGSIAVFHGPGPCRSMSGVRCPYGGHGDVLWVREAWSPKSNAGYLNEDDGSITITYADGATKYVDDYGDVMGDWTIPAAAKKGPLTPIFMPRWASRLSLEIVAVRVERLNEITEADAQAEGVDPQLPLKQLAEENRLTMRHLEFSQLIPFPHKIAFARTWDALNAKRDGGAYAWAKSPWVWVVEFRRVDSTN